MPPEIPDRWLNYTPVGENVNGTRFIAFKVPLRKAISDSVRKELRLSCDSLLTKIPNLGMIIDLTNTYRYYDPQFFVANGLRYEKLMIPGKSVPPLRLVEIFRRIVSTFLEENAGNSKLIGVHCTHGVNRTGYLISDFMISKLKMNPVEAIKSFEDARGHRIERQNYRDSLMAFEHQNNLLNSSLPVNRNISDDWRTRRYRDVRSSKYNRNYSNNNDAVANNIQRWRKNTNNRFNTRYTNKGNGCGSRHNSNYIDNSNWRKPCTRNARKDNKMDDDLYQRRRTKYDD